MNSPGAGPGLPRRRQHGRRVDVGVAVDHPQPHELGLLETRNQPEHAALIRPPELRLEADQAEVVGREIVLPELDHRVRLAPRGRVREPDRLHRTEPQRVDAAVGHHLDRQAALEVGRAVEVVQLGQLRGRERLVEPLVLRRGHGTVQVVPPPPRPRRRTSVRPRRPSYAPAGRGARRGRPGSGRSSRPGR